MQVSEEEVQQLIQCLPRAPSIWGKHHELLNYQGFWYDSTFIPGIVKCQTQFTARDTDIFVNSFPKTGTTWLKSLVFSISNRKNYTISQTPLLKHNPHDLVYGLEYNIYQNVNEYPGPNQLDDIPTPRLLSTQLSYGLLPESIKASKAKILYIARNPSDTVVSLYFFFVSFMKKVQGEHYQPLSVEDFFERFCDGSHDFGPYFDHVLEYWKLSLEQPDRVLFLKYEDLKANPTPHLKRLAEFIGMPFSPQEEIDGVVSGIIELCSFKKAKDLEVNKSGAIMNNTVEKKSFYRKGEVGDWTNHFTPLMAEKMDTLMQQRFKDTGLSFKLLPDN